MNWRRALQWGASLGVFVLLVIVLVRNGSRLGEHLDELSIPSLAAAFAAVLAGLFASMLAWRAVLADLGSPLPLAVAARVFFLSQVGKYVPGSVWPYLAQMQLGKGHGVPRSRSGAVGLITVALSLLSGLVVAAVTLPFASGDAVTHYWWAFVAIPVLGVALVPSVMNRALALLLRLTRRGEVDLTLSERGILAGMGWSALGWACFGVHVAVLAHALGAHGATLLPAATGAFALAWSVGFLVVVAPAGAGVREAVLVLALRPVLDADAALLVALVSRALMSLGDVAAVGLVSAVGRTRRPVAVDDEHEDQDEASITS